MLNRRQLFAALAAGAILTAEGLWVPGAKKIFLPPHRVWVPLPHNMLITTLEWQPYLPQCWNTCHTKGWAPYHDGHIYEVDELTRSGHTDKRVDGSYLNLRSRLLDAHTPGSYNWVDMDHSFVKEEFSYLNLDFWRLGHLIRNS